MSELSTNILAEEALLGSVLEHPANLPEVIELVKPQMFYEAQHELIFSTIVDLYNASEPYDPIAVASRLIKQGQITNAGGIERITQLVSPSTSTLRGSDPISYSILVVEAYKLRQLHEVSTIIRDFSIPGKNLSAVEAIESSHEALVDLVNEQTSEETTFVAGEVLESQLEYFKNLENLPEDNTSGLSTGFPRLDSMFGGLKPGFFCVVAARPGLGKALHIDTPILTTKGWKTMGTITTQDVIYGNDGKTTNIVEVHPIHERESYEIITDTAESIVASAEHLWEVYSKNSNSSRADKESLEAIKQSGQYSGNYDTAELLNIFSNVVSTDEIFAALEPLTPIFSAGTLKTFAEVHAFHNRVTKKHVTNSLGNGVALTLKESAQKLFGKSTSTTQESKLKLILERDPKEISFTLSYDFDRVFAELYTRAGENLGERQILDTKTLATTQLDNAWIIRSAEPFQAPENPNYGKEFLRELGHSLLYMKPVIEHVENLSINQRKTIFEGLLEESKKGDIYGYMDSTVIFSQHNKLFVQELLNSLGYKAKKVAIQGDQFVYKFEAHKHRRIVTIRHHGVQQVRCITVAANNHMFLAGEALIPTHNSTLAVDFARSGAFLADKTVLFFSLEMSIKEIMARIIAAEARVEHSKIDKGLLTPDDWVNIGIAKEKILRGNLVIDTKPDTTITRIRALAMKQAMKPEGLDLIVIDYLQLIESSDTKAPRQEQVRILSRAIKVLAKELGVPIVALSQLNRDSEKREDGKPSVADLRESGALEQDADIVLLVHRPEVHDPHNRPGQTDLIVGKNRHGPTGTVQLVSMLQFSKFVPGEGSLDQSLTEQMEAGQVSLEGDMFSESTDVRYSYGATDDAPPEQPSPVAFRDPEVGSEPAFFDSNSDILWPE